MNMSFPVINNLLHLKYRFGVHISTLSLTHSQMNTCMMVPTDELLLRLVRVVKCQSGFVWHDFVLKYL